MPQQSTCVSLMTYGATVPVTSEGCQTFDSVRAFQAPRNAAGSLQWSMLDADGNPVDLRGCGNDPAVSEDPDDLPIAKARFTEAVGPVTDNNVYESDATITDPENGTLSVPLPDEVRNFSGIYEIQFGILDPDGNVMVSNDSFIIIQPGLFGDSKHRGKGPPTLDEMRVRLRDFAVANVKYEQQEFSPTELLYCLVQPLKEWNELPPDLPYSRVRSTNFKFREHWLKGATGYLLELAAQHYRRNVTTYSAGGVTVDDKGMEASYVRASQMFLKEWRDFLARKKAELMFQRSFGVTGSDYSRLPRTTNWKW